MIDFMVSRIPFVTDGISAFLFLVWAVSFVAFIVLFVSYERDERGK